ncbi:MAG: DUF1080 domain-containing protein [Planctomycetes bacterium]|nr:DUF1080 domain-containing protein [Planctomycetota bacterium]
MSKQSFLLPLLLLTCTVFAADTVTPFNGKDLAGWTGRGKDGATGGWTVGAARVSPDHPDQLVADAGGDQLINISAGHGKSVDLFTQQKFGDVTVELELMVPKGSNSGVYLMGEYEVQVLDSYGKDDSAGKGDLGAIYNVQAPTSPHYKKPGEWQTLKIEFLAPRFDTAGKKIANAKFTRVELNGSVIQTNVEAPHPTGSQLSNTETPTGPLMFQGDHGAVAYRNIKITPAD